MRTEKHKQLTISIGKSKLVINLLTTLTEEELVRVPDIISFIRNRISDTKLISINLFQDNKHKEQIHPYNPLVGGSKEWKEAYNYRKV